MRWRNRCLQVSEAERKLALAGKEVLVRELLDGRVQLVHRGRILKYQELAQQPPRDRAPTPPQPGGKRSSYKPAANHPWRRGYEERTSRNGTPAPLGQLIQEVAKNRGIPKLGTATDTKARS